MFLRWLGQSQDFAPFNHPLVQQPYLIFAETDGFSEAPPQSKVAIDKLKKLCPECIPKIDARRSLDGKWYAFPSSSLAEFSSLEGYFSLTPSKTIEKTNHILSLQQAVELFPNTPFLIVVHSRDASQLNEVLKALKSRKNQENIILQSPFRQILTDARKQRPTWLFGISPSGMARLVMMEALYIEPMADIWSDLIIAPVEIHKTKVFTPRLLAELRRRHKLLILENPGPLDQLPAPLQKAVNGVITKNISEALSYFKSRSIKSN